ncbi:21 kDa protein [Ricinus communis]|uniref:21 kDa protein n=1 Tax=Ricinus communis TaxID=3988 RepID=UPI00201A4D12|nr:21 kDa protein [Ricinus communis]
MPNLSLSLLLLVLSIFSISGPVESRLDRNSPARANIYKLCKNTTYPILCFQYLSIFPISVTENPKRVARAALLVSLYRVQKTRVFIKKASIKLKAKKGKEISYKVKDYQVVEDCLEVFGDGVDDLSKSIIELHHLQGLEGQERKTYGDCDMACHVSNIQTSLSAALSDASTCVDEFDDFLRRKRLGKLMATIKAKALNAEQATTNGLDLFCQFAKCAN